MKNVVDYLNLQQINASFEPQLTQAMACCVASGRYLQGEAVTRFERQFAAYCGTDYCIGTGNGLDALTLILLSYRELGMLKEGDEAIVPANTYIATLLSVIRAGLKPVLCEPSPLTGNMDVDCLPSLITDKTRVIIPVHLYGNLADMESILAVARPHGLLVVEDAAQAHGAGALKRAGAWGDAAAFSFYPAKNLGALGDGGAVTTNDLQLSKVVRALGNYGSSQKYHHRFQGINSRLDELQATALSVKLPRLDADNARRSAIAQRYLSEIHWHPSRLRTLSTDLSTRPVYHVFPLFSPYRDALQAHLTRCGVGTLMHYPVPPHRQPALQAMYEGLTLPVTELFASEELSIPISPLLTEEEISYVIACVNSWVDA